MTQSRSFFAELRRRNVIRAAVLYIGAVWALAQGISQLGPTVAAPDWTTRWFLVAAAVGFPFWIAFARFYEFTPEGLKRERDVEPGESITPDTGRKLDFAIIAVLAVAVVLLLTDRFVLRHGVNAQTAASIPSIDTDPSIASKDPAIATILIEPLFAPLHGDPRWLPFLRKIGYTPEQLAKIELKVTLPQ
jgi:hypothetical protein